MRHIFKNFPVLPPVKTLTKFRYRLTPSRNIQKNDDNRKYWCSPATTLQPVVAGPFGLLSDPARKTISVRSRASDKLTRILDGTFFRTSLEIVDEMLTQFKHLLYDHLYSVEAEL